MFARNVLALLLILEIAAPWAAAAAERHGGATLLAEAGRKIPVNTKNDMRIAAVVNSEIITMHDLATRLDFVIRTSRLPDNDKIRQRMAPQVLRALIEEHIKRQEAKRLGIKVSKKELAKAVIRVEKNNHMKPGQLLDVLKRLGIDPHTMIDQIETAVAWNKVVKARIRPRVQVSNDEVREAIARIKSGQGRVQYRVSEIFLAVDSPQQEAETRRSAQRLFDQIKKGVEFSRLAAQFSQSPTASVGGDLGYVDLETMNKELADQIQQMKVGQVAGPIRTVGGYYILHLRERKVVGAPDPNRVTVSLAQVAMRFPKGAGAKQKSEVEERARGLAAEAKSCDDMEKLGKKAGAGATRLRNVRVVNLGDDLREPARTLAVGKASDPIVERSGVVVMMVCDRKGDNAIPDVQQIRNAIGRRELNLMVRRYLRDLRRSAFLDLRV
jgi:peptidyl-prolyl cis-trans isomerase SurA